MGTRKFAARAALATAAWWAAQAVHAATIVVAQVGPMSGLEASQGRAYATGMQLWFNAVNKAGGINGHTFSLVRRDDAGRPEDTVTATKAVLAEDKPMVLAGYVGSKNITDLVATGMLEKERIALVGYRTTEIRPDTPLLYSVRATLADELNKLTEHLATIGITRLGLFYEDGPGAAALLKAADDAAAKAKASIASKASYPPGTARVTPAVDVFLKNPPQAILMISSGGAAAGFIEQYRSGGGAAQLFAHSGADIEQMSKRLSEEQMQGVAIAQVTPSPYKISTRLAKEFNDLAKANTLEVPVSYSMMEGFIAAKVIVEAVRRQGAKPTREAMATTLDAMESYDLGGYVVGFRPNKRNGSRFVELSIVSGSGRIRQ
ncbi:MAG TPA: ABC transporter substrate-binding protein [Ramlibacter sp.]|uniref:ABC transporter substrate-binding protein n=1 Tax=Ramlibacter sp. TaxID=1917967 RepID=UPI002ED31EC3